MTTYPQSEPPDYEPRAGWSQTRGDGGWCLDPAASGWRIRYFSPRAYAQVYLDPPYPTLVEVTRPSGMLHLTGKFDSAREAEDFVMAYIAWALAWRAP